MLRSTPSSNTARNPAFDAYFSHATGSTPFPFQRDFAGEARPDWKGEIGVPALVDVPTGLGKTAMAVLGWLWRRRFAAEDVRRATPRRLVYCLPMRVLVEQTRDNTTRWIASLRKAGLLAECVPISVLMGGEDPGESEWDTNPERDAIIIGTQDMLLSRALNRGYAASRARWPMYFGLLNTDCLWVFDEIQLMGSGLATTAQLEAFRRQLAGEGGPKDNRCASVWMSATLRPAWLKTVDFKDRIDDSGRIDGKTTLSLSEADRQDERVMARLTATKPLQKATVPISEKADAKALAALAQVVRDSHKPGSRTIVVVNTVKRACALFKALHQVVCDGTASKRGRRGGREAAAGASAAEPHGGSPLSGPKLVLVHSRFRPPERAKQVDEALADVDPHGLGTIMVSTQVIEAGVDVSAATLFTELAPWASLVQRFGRCNRRGELNGRASVHWIDLPGDDADADEVRHPYELTDLRAAAAELESLSDVGIKSLTTHQKSLSDERKTTLFPHRHTHVIRRKDMLDLFDTTPDLAGNDIDIDCYVREIDETDVRVFWRDYGDPDPKQQGATPNDIKGEGRAGGPYRKEPATLRNELCPVPIGEFKAFAKQNRGRVWRWNFTERFWEQAEPETIAPGQALLVHAAVGGYSAERGWSGKPDDIPSLDHAPAEASPSEADGYEDDYGSQTGVWQSIAEHTRDVCVEADRMLSLLDCSEGVARAVRLAARWHDWGKTHTVFQHAITLDGRPDDRSISRELAKAPKGSWKRYCRRHFRHELASALAVLQRPHDDLKSLSDDDLNLVAYLIAAHHGKVRLSIRSMPNEQKPSPRTHGLGGVPRDRRFARGVWDGDMLPSVDLGGGVVAPAVTLSLEPMEMGLCEAEPFVGQPSWMERVLRLRDRLGPFRLAYLEAVLRAADARASAHAAANAVPKPTEVSHA